MQLIGRDNRRRMARLLRVVGTVELLAFGAVVMPRTWMETAHAWLGMGDMPAGAVVDFMIRQASFIYGLHGLGMWWLASDVVRYRPLIILTGIAYILAGPVFVTIDYASGMPWFWILTDGPGCVLAGAAILWPAWNDAGDAAGS